MAGQFWRGATTFGLPDARYENGQIWLGATTFGLPDARYDSDDDGAAACAFLLLF